jgi:hypothetical protein
LKSGSGQISVEPAAGCGPGKADAAMSFGSVDNIITPEASPTLPRVSDPLVSHTSTVEPVTGHSPASCGLCGSDNAPWRFDVGYTSATAQIALAARWWVCTKCSQFVRDGEVERLTEIFIMSAQLDIVTAEAVATTFIHHAHPATV